MKGALSFDTGFLPAPQTAADTAQISATLTAQNSPQTATPGNPPAEWLHGMELLGDRHCPRLAKPERWQQIVRDCWAIITDWASLVIEAGWSIENVFGFDPEGMSRDYGLAVALRGGRLIGFHDGHAVIRRGASVVAQPDAEYFNHYPHLERGAPLLWTFDERKL